MPGMRRRPRWIAVLLAIMLLPFGQLAGIPIQQASAQNDGLLELRQWGFNADNNGAWFDLDIFYDEGPYDLFLRLYRRTMTDQYEPVQEEQALISFTQSESEAHADVKLSPGTYKIVFELAVDDEGILDQVESIFSLSGPSLSVILFGADEDTPVELYNGWDEYVVPLLAYEVGDGYVLYTYEVYSYGYYLFRSPGHPSFGEQSIYPVSQWQYIYHLDQPQYGVVLLDYDIAVEDGFLSGYIAFYGSEDLYRLVFTDQNGGVIGACVEEIEYDSWSEMGTIVDVRCDLPSGAKSLRLDAVVDGFAFPTNLVLHVDPIRPPGQIRMEDGHSEIDVIDLRVRFEDSPDASDIAFYKVYAEGSESVLYVTAGSGQYDLQVDAAYTFPGDWLTIRMIGKDGHEHIAHTKLPLIDDISGMTGNIEFACENGGGVGTMSIQSDPSRYYCEKFSSFEDEELVPQDAKYRNGTIGWTLPDTGDLDLTAYDLYYANEDMEMIRGDVRINSPEVSGTGSFAYTPSNVPEDAAYVAVVTLLFGWEEEGEGYGYYNNYFVPPFFVPIEQEAPQPQMLAQLKVNGIDALPVGNEPNRYTAVVGADAEEALITGSSPDGIVIVDGTELGANVPSVAVTLDGPETDVTIIVRSHNDEQLQTTYVLTIVRQQLDQLVEESDFILLDDGSYGYIPRGMTAGELMDKFRFASDAEAVILNGEHELDRFDPVTPGSILMVTLGERREEFALRFLSELLRPSGMEPVTVAHVAVFVIAQLTAEDPVDLTGDGGFDQDDVRMLLGELEY